LTSQELLGNGIRLAERLKLCDEDRKRTFGSIEPSAVERARAVIERIERARKARAENEARTTEEAKAK
jgi:hypothetical protein